MKFNKLFSIFSVVFFLGLMNNLFSMRIKSIYNLDDEFKKRTEINLSRPLAQPEAYSNTISPCGNYVAGVSKGGKLAILDIRDKEMPKKINSKYNLPFSNIRYLWLNHNGNHIALGTSTGFEVWDIRDEKNPKKTFSHKYRFGFHIRRLCLSQDGNCLALGYMFKGLRVLDIRDRENPKEILSWRGGNPHRLCFSQDGSRLALATYGGDIKVWDIRNKKKPKGVFSRGIKNLPSRLHLNQDGSRIAFSSGTGFEVWDIRDEKNPEKIFSFAKKSIYRGYGNPIIKCACLSPDGNYVALGIRRVVIVLDIRDRKCPREITTYYHDNAAHYLCFSLNGDKFVSIEKTGKEVITHETSRNYQKAQRKYRSENLDEKEETDYLKKVISKSILKKARNYTKNKINPFLLKRLLEEEEKEAQGADKLTRKVAPKSILDEILEDSEILPMQLSNKITNVSSKAVNILNMNKRHVLKVFYVGRDGKGRLLSLEPSTKVKTSNDDIDPDLSQPIRWMYMRGKEIIKAGNAQFPVSANKIMINMESYSLLGNEKY